ncbi:helix-turn-helix domain-containing protein [Thalassospira sp. CH_XMU1420-2]|uniref:helix-turn-helix domain-containing protein n=1 Tax=Thalassospira sp. CH_XMU1420-2 TaxID=3107769 RepID=UPI003008F5FE|tara:strand:- start:10786 stop:11160 length:375 start_codon:yes stop_codon:yes gene_type:complete
MHKIDYEIASTQQVQQTIGERLNQYRIHLGLQQEALAQEAGLSRSAVARLLDGKGGTFNSFLRVLRAMQLLEKLDALIPEPRNGPLAPPNSKPLSERERVRRSNKPEPVWQGFDDSAPVFEDDQ